MNAERKLQQARCELILSQPFFGALALRLKLQVMPEIKTAGTDGQILAYNPAFIDSLTVSQTTGLLAHEVLHIANGHPWRRDGRDHQTWNQATDFAVNPILKQAGFYLPPDGLLDPQYAGQSAEAVYQSIKQKQQQPQPQSQPQAGQGGGQGGQQPQPSAGQDDGQPDDQSDQPQGSGWGDVMDNLADDSAAQQAEWQVATLQAAAAAKAQGKLPGGLERLIDSIKHPAIDWRGALRRFVQESAKADYTWKTPSARYLAGGLYLPSLRSEQMRPLVVAVDTSGSIGGPELAAFGAEIQAIMDECQPESLTVIFCDAKVQAVQEFQPLDDIKLTPKGGGGTDLRKCFDWVAQRSEEPACMILLTDLETPFPSAPPAYPVLWVTNSRHVAPLGETLRMETA